MQGPWQHGSRPSLAVQLDQRSQVLHRTGLATNSFFFVSFSKKKSLICPLDKSGAGVICYQSHCYTRKAIPTLLLSVTATNWIATTISATDINCYLLPLLQPELLSSFTATLHFCYKGTHLNLGIGNSGMAES